MRLGIPIIAAVCLAAGALSAAMFPVRQAAIWCDPVSGSLKRQTAWLFGITAGPRYEVSPLETRLRAVGYAWPRAWQFVGNDRYTILERPVEFECGSAPPPIYSIRCALDGYARAATPEELRRFADVMRAGTGPEQRAAVDAAGEKGLAVPMFPPNASSRDSSTVRRPPGR